MILQTIKKVCLIFLILIFIAVPSALTSYLKYYYGIILGGVPTFLIYFLFYAPEIFFVKLLIKKPKKAPFPPKEHSVTGRRIFYIVFTVLLIALPFGLWYLYQKYQYHKFSFLYDILVGCTIYIPCLMTALFLIYKFCRTFPKRKGGRTLFNRDPIYRQITNDCRQNISVYEEYIRTHLPEIEAHDLDVRTKAYMSAKSAYLCSVVKSSLEVIYTSKPSLYFELVSLPELRKENPALPAGEFYSQCILALKGKRPKASVVQQMNMQQSKLMDEAMIRIVQQKEVSTGETLSRHKILSELKNKNRTEEEQANERETEGPLSDDRRMIRIVSWIIAACVLAFTILSIIVSIGGTL